MSLPSTDTRGSGPGEQRRGEIENVENSNPDESILTRRITLDVVILFCSFKVFAVRIAVRDVHRIMRE
jgi:hypothetical protein